MSPFQNGDDGDGNPGFGTLNTVAVTSDTQVPAPFVWFKVIVTNTGGQTATGVQVTDTRGALPYGQNNATADLRRDAREPRRQCVVAMSIQGGAVLGLAGDDRQHGIRHGDERRGRRR